MTWADLENLWYVKKVVMCVTLTIGSIQNRQIGRDRKSTSGHLQLGMGLKGGTGTVL